MQKCYEDKSFEYETYTDEASMIENSGHKIMVVQGDYENIKITTKEDLKIAEEIISNR